MTNQTAADLGTQVLTWLRGYNAVDVVLAVFFLIYTLDGIRRGFIAGALGVASVFLTLLAALAWHQPVGVWLGQYLSLPPLLLNIAGFFVVLALAQLVLSLAIRFLLVAILPFRLLLGPLALLDNIFGFIPGLAQAALIAALVIAPFQAFPYFPPVTATVNHSALAQMVMRGVAAVSPRLQEVMNQGLNQTASFQTQVVEPDDNIKLPPQTNLQVDPASEETMFTLLNAERTKAGLRPLVADPAMREVARQHSSEMLRLGYFAHSSPKTGGPADRLQAAGLYYPIIGENLAFAPNVEEAHKGLMLSPGHRANILKPEYTRVGIGVINVPDYGRMFTQEFAS